MNSSVKDRKITRRFFLRIMGWGSFFVTLGISAVGIIRFLFPRVLFEEPSTFNVGFPHEFNVEAKSVNTNSIEVFEKWKQEQSIWIVRENDRLYAIHSKCTHLGCTPNYYADEGIFKCPCHGSQFNSDGVNFAGPAPRPLDRCMIYIADDGVICVDKSRIYTHKEFNKMGAYLKL